MAKKQRGAIIRRSAKALKPFKPGMALSGKLSRHKLVAGSTSQEAADREAEKLEAKPGVKDVRVVDLKGSLIFVKRGKTPRVSPKRPKLSR